MKYPFHIALLLLGLFLSFSIYGQQTDSVYQLIKPKEDNVDISGNNQIQKAGTKLSYPIMVQVLSAEGVPVVDEVVNFKILDFPASSEGFIVSKKQCHTDSLGYAYTEFTLGDQEGTYSIIISLIDHPESGFLTYHFQARPKNWVLMLVIGMFGGLALFLFGMFMMSEGMKRAAGENLRSLLSKVTKNRFRAVVLGTFITMIIQSSSATTVMLITFVQSKLIKFRQTLGVVLGAGIGTTITAQIIAFHLSDYSLLLIAVGFSIQAFTKTDRIKSIGTTLLGFGILFFAMDIMSTAMYPLRTYPPILDFLVHMKNPWLGMLAGAIFTAAIQSSSASIGILIVLSSQGLINLESAIPLVLGANIGTAITAILASIKANREARKVAFAHTAFKIIGVLFFIGAIPILKEIIVMISPKTINGSTTYGHLARQIANTHMVFNIGLTIILLPFLNSIFKAINFLIPEKEELTEQKLIIRYLDYKKMNTPSLALSLAKQETMRMGRKVQEMVDDILIPFLTKQTESLDDVESKEKEINFLRDKINQYLLQISKESTNEVQTREAFQSMYIVKEMEQIADIISKTLLLKAKKWSDKDYEFSPEGKNEIIESHLFAQKQISRALNIIEEVNLEKAQHMNAKYKKYRAIYIDFEKNHYERLKNEIPQSLRSSKTHLELITLLRTITSHATNIARILLKWTED